jgi:NAD(P)-dependent dehydrogenase (short-subunit alcohol dehydrogenase family)
MSKRTYLVTGAASGLGAAIVKALMEDGQGQRSVIQWDLAFGDDVRAPQGVCPPIDVLVNCAGINRTAWLENLDEATWDEVMDVNAKGIYRMTQWALPALSRAQGTVLNIVSNASHMPMTCSAAYNASKGAAHILTLQMARELTKKHGITVFGISPNKLAGTQMSKDIERQVLRDRGWTPEFAAQYQRAALLCGEETDPATLAEFVCYLLQTKERHKYLTGCVIPYGA